jgi:hypothetical protein
MSNDDDKKLTSDEKVAEKRAKEDAAVARAAALQDVNLDVSFGSLVGLVPELLRLVELGVSVDTMAEHLAKVLYPAAVPALTTLADVLNAAAALLKKV